MEIPICRIEADAVDQATASIDVETAVHIQQVLRDELKESTIITIAHRLEAVRHANYQLVLQDGRVASQGPIAVETTEREAADRGVAASN